MNLIAREACRNVAVFPKKLKPVKSREGIYVLQIRDVLEEQLSALLILDPRKFAVQEEDIVHLPLYLKIMNVKSITEFAEQEVALAMSRQLLFPVDLQEVVVVFKKQKEKVISGFGFY